MTPKSPPCDWTTWIFRQVRWEFLVHDLIKGRLMFTSKSFFIDSHHIFVISLHVFVSLEFLPVRAMGIQQLLLKEDFFLQRWHKRQGTYPGECWHLLLFVGIRIMPSNPVSKTTRTGQRSFNNYRSNQGFTSKGWCRVSLSIV